MKQGASSRPTAVKWRMEWKRGELHERHEPRTVQTETVMMKKVLAIKHPPLLIKRLLTNFEL